MADTFTLKGDINALDTGATFSGTVTITPSKRFTLGNSEYPIAPLTTSIASDGQYTFTGLVLPDSVNVSPQNFTYRMNYAVVVVPTTGPSRIEAWQRDVTVTSSMVVAGVVEMRQLQEVSVPGSPSPFLTRQQVLDLITQYGGGGGADLSEVADAFLDETSEIFVSTATKFVQIKNLPDLSGFTTKNYVDTQLATKANKDGVVRTVNNQAPDSNGNFNIATGLTVPNPVTLITGRSAPKAVLCCQDNAAIYDVVSNKTFLSYLGVSRALYVKEFDHGTLTWSDDIFVADYPTAVGIEDDHGTPSMTILPNGKLFIVFGSHQTAPIFCTSSVARSVTGGWTSATGPAVTVGTYHAVATSGSKVFCLFRAGTGHNGSSSAPATYPSHEFAGLAVSTDNGATWTQAGPIANLNVYSAPSVESGKDFYHSGFKAVGDYLYFTWTIAHGVLHDGERSHMYVAKYQVSTGKVFSQDGVDLGTIIDTKAKLDACIAVNGDFAQGGRFLVESDGTFVSAASFQATDGTLATYFVKRAPADSAWLVRDIGLRRHYGFADHHIARKAGGGYVVYAVTGREGEPTILKNINEKVSYVGVGGDLTVAFTTDGGTTWAANQVMSRWQTAGQGVQGPTCPENAHPTMSAIVVAGSVSGGLSGGLPTDRLPLYGVSQTVANATQILAAAQAGTKSIQYFNRVQFANNPSKPANGTWGTFDLNNYVPFNATRVLVNVSAFFNGIAGRVTMAFRRNGTNRDGDASFAFNAGGPPAGGEVWVPIGPNKKIDWSVGQGATSTDPQFGALYFNLVGFETEGGGASSAGRPYTLAAPVPILYTPPAGADTTPPTAPTSVAAAGGPGSITLTPSGATDNVAVTGYKAYDNQTGGTSLATGSTAVTVSGLTAGVARQFWVSAFDANGNESSRTQSASATPTGAPSVPATAYVAPSGVTATPSFQIIGDQVSRSGSTFTSWTDYIGNLVSSVPSGKNAPVVAVDSFGSGKHGIQFTAASTTGLLWAKAMSGSGQTVIIAARVPSTTAGRMWWAGATSDAEPAGAPIVYNNTTAQVTARLGGGVQSTTSTATGNTLVANAASVHRASFSTSNTARIVKSVLNGNVIATTTGTSTTSPATASVGLGIGGVGTDYADITIGLVQVFDSELSESDAHAYTVAAANWAGATVGAN